MAKSKKSPFDYTWVNMGPFSFSPKALTQGMFIASMDGVPMSAALPGSIGRSNTAPITNLEAFGGRPAPQVTQPGFTPPNAPPPINITPASAPAPSMYSPAGLTLQDYAMWLNSLRSTPVMVQDYSKYYGPEYRRGY